MRANVVERSMTRFLRRPPSVRGAASVIVTVTAAVVVGGGVLMRVLDHSEYASIWVGMWWALQTVTTVGYGDVTPVKPIGRIIASFVMLEGIAFVTIVIAAITSTFVARAAKEGDLQGELLADDTAVESGVEAQLKAIEERLARIEERLGAHGS
jgi:voltage-gated potassium channel Kch